MNARLPIGCAALLLSAAVSASGGQPIEITDFKHEFDGSLVKIAWAARSNNPDVAIGSFAISVRSQPEGFTIPGTAVVKSARFFLNPDDAPKESEGCHAGSQLDNGAFDLDKRDGHFTVNIDTKGYKPGRYSFGVTVDNRPPLKGRYHYGFRGMVFEIGDDGALREYMIAQPPPGAEHDVLYIKEGIYAAFPQLMVRPDGKWMLHFPTKTSRAHINPDGGSLTMLSDDEGRTWLPTDDAPFTDRMTLAKNGTKLVVAQAEGWLYVPDAERGRLAGERRIISNVRPGEIAYLGGAIVKTSADAGKTWTTAKIDIPEDVVGLMNHHLFSQAMTTKEGVRLAAVYGYRLITDPDGSKIRGGSEVFILRSDDDGETWSFIPMLPRPPDGRKNELGFSETAIAQAADGSVFLMMRTQPHTTMRISRSTDLGKTWSTPADTGLLGHPADMITLADGRILCVYGFRYGSTGVHAAVTVDGGRTWSTPVAIRDDGVGTGDLGYPMALQRKDGKVFTVYYHTTDAVDTHIAATVWDPATAWP